MGRCRPISELVPPSLAGRALAVFEPSHSSAHEAGLRLSCPVAPPVEATSGAAGFEPWSRSGAGELAAGGEGASACKEQQPDSGACADPGVAGRAVFRRT